MRALKKIALIAALYCLALVQSSFLIHFGIFGYIPNLILISVLILNILESPNEKFGVFFAAFGGFLVDVFSSRQIGLNLIMYFSMALIIKYILKNHVRISYGKDI